MNLLFLIGLEGTGHHLFKDCCSYQEDPHLHYLLVLYFDKGTTEEARPILKDGINSFVRNHKNSNIIERASFPYYDALGGEQFYDIEEFYKLFSENPDVNVFFTIVVRNIVCSTLSIHNRPGRIKDSRGRSVIDEAKIQERHLKYINNQVQLLPTDKYVVVTYNDICRNIKALEKILQDRSHFNDLFFDEKKIRPADDTKHIRSKHFNNLTNYFTRERTKCFDYLISNLTRITTPARAPPARPRGRRPVPSPPSCCRTAPARRTRPGSARRSPRPSSGRAGRTGGGPDARRARPASRPGRSRHSPPRRPAPRS